MTKHEQQFRKFDDDNPHVFDKIREIARFIIDKGKSRYGIGAVFERLRWISSFETVGDVYKLNNNFRAFYARKLMADPEFEGLFQLRRSVADKALAL